MRAFQDLTLCGRPTETRWIELLALASMAKVKKGVKKFQKKIAGGGVHKKKKLHFRRDKADAAKAAEVREQSAAAKEKKSGALGCAHCCRRASQLRPHPHRQSQLY